MKIFQKLLIIVLLFAMAACTTTSDNESETYTVGIVNIASILNPVVDGFKDGMAEFNYTEGENITYIYNGPVSRDNLESEIQSLIDAEVDVILSLTTPATVTAKGLTADNQIPVVFVPVNDPVGAGIVEDTSKPGGNITGIISGASETRRLEWLLTVAPEAKVVYFPYNPDDPSPVQTLETFNDGIAEDLGIELVTYEVTSADALPDAIANTPENVDAIYLPSDSRVGSALTDWLALAEERQLPLSGSSQAHVSAGALCSFSYSPYEAGKQSANLVNQILTGTNAGDLPIEFAEPLLSVNIPAAEAIGLEIPDDVLIQANIIVRDDEEGEG